MLNSSQEMRSPHWSLAVYSPILRKHQPGMPLTAGPQLLCAAYSMGWKQEGGGLPLNFRTSISAAHPRGCFKGTKSRGVWLFGKLAKIPAQLTPVLNTTALFTNDFFFFLSSGLSQASFLSDSNEILGMM